jgi:hypothetical protein
MKIRHKVNKGTADVSDALAESLIATGLWEPADKPVRASRATKPAEPTE